MEIQIIYSIGSSSESLYEESVGLCWQEHRLVAVPYEIRL